MKKYSYLLTGIGVITTLPASAAISISSFDDFAIDAAQVGSPYSSAPNAGNDGGANNLYSADSPISVTSAFTLGAGEKLVGILQYHNSAATTSPVTNLQFGGQAVNTFESIGAGFTSFSMFYYDNIGPDIVNGDISFEFSFDAATLEANRTNGSGSGGGGLDEFTFTLYSLSGALLGGPRDFDSTTSQNAMPNIAAEVGDFIIMAGQRNNGGAVAGASTGMTLDTALSAGNLKSSVASGFGDSDTITAGQTNTFFDVSGTRTDASSIATFAAIPEPSLTALLGLGGLALIIRRRRA